MRGRKAPLLLRRSERDQRRTQQFLAEVVDLVRRVGAGVFLVERHPVRGREPPPAVFFRPAQAGQPRGGQALIPRPAFLERFVLAPRPAEALKCREFAGQIVGEPTADLRPELLDVLHAL